MSIVVIIISFLESSIYKKYLIQTTFKISNQIIIKSIKVFKINQVIDFIKYYLLTSAEFI